MNRERATERNAATNYVLEGNKVTRFFFHFSSRDQFVADQKGRELEHIGAAHRHALLLIEKAVLLLSHELNWSGWSIDVSDSTGRTLLNVLFPRHLGICSSRLPKPRGPRVI
jgi:hypothetical protein